MEKEEDRSLSLLEGDNGRGILGALFQSYVIGIERESEGVGRYLQLISV